MVGENIFLTLFGVIVVDEVVCRLIWFIGVRINFPPFFISPVTERLNIFGALDKLVDKFWFIIWSGLIVIIFPGTFFFWLICTFLVIILGGVCVTFNASFPASVLKY